MTYDVVVVGAGVMGASIALEFQRAGRAVMVVDKGDAVGGASTSASSSVVRFNYSTRDGVVAAWESAHMWMDWEDHLRGGTSDGSRLDAKSVGPHLAEFHSIGMLIILSSDYDLRPALGHFDELGLPYESLGATQLTERFPTVDFGRYHPPRLASDPSFFDDANGQVSAVYTPGAGFIDDPQLSAVNMMDAAVAHGATLQLRRQVVAINSVGSTNRQVTGVRLADGTEIEASVVVNAAGPWSSQLNKLADVLDDMAVSTRALRQTVAASQAPDDFGVGNGGVMFGDLDLGTYSRPHSGGSYLVGGIEADCDPLLWTDDPDSATGNPDPEMFETLMYRAARRVPSLSIPHRPMGVAGDYDVTDDWVPIYDRTNLDGYYLAIGTSGNQFKNAPLVGKIILALDEAAKNGHDHDQEPVVLHCERTGLDLGLGQFSRNRAPAATGGNVMG